MIHSSNRFNFETAISFACKFNEETNIHVISSSDKVTEDINRNVNRYSCKEGNLCAESISDLETLSTFNIVWLVITEKAFSNTLISLNF